MASDMSAATKELLGRVRQMVPPMLDKFHKGQQGRIGVLGGSEDYTGAPYFSAMASARLGCDMSHVICTPGAAAVIKTYSPNLMVHPLMRQSPSPTASASSSADESAEKIASRIIDMLPRLHCLVIGPGLGRDPLMQDTVAKVIEAARKSNIPLVLDADALQVVQNSPEIVKGYKLAVLTPNVVEFGRLCKALGIEKEVKKAAESGPGGESNETAKVEALAQALDGPTIVQKGFHDFISDGKTTLTMDLTGGQKRSGGQGDTLTGSIATFLGWRNAYLQELWDHGNELKESELMQLACFGGCAITRECSCRAFNAKGRSLQASDLTDEVHPSFLHLFGEDDPDAGGPKL
ncbi:unnamed protein product [Discula destructiva]